MVERISTIRRSWLRCALRPAEDFSFEVDRDVLDSVVKKEKQMGNKWFFAPINVKTCVVSDMMRHLSALIC